MQASRPIQYQMGEPSARPAQRAFENDNYQCGMPMAYAGQSHTTTTMEADGESTYADNSVWADTARPSKSAKPIYPHSPQFGLEGSVACFCNKSALVGQFYPPLYSVAQM